MSISTRGFRDPTKVGRLGRLRLSPGRSPESQSLDAAERIEPVPYLPWNQFYQYFRDTFRQGEHVLLLGRTGSGKTTAAVEFILPLRRYVVVLATKSRDDSLYRPLMDRGFIMTDEWDIDPMETPRVIFRPRLAAPTAAARDAQRLAFQEVLIDIFETGRWCLFLDEIRYLTDNLGLRTEIETLYLQGRSAGISMVVGTQRPVSIPLVAFDQSTHLFTWRLTEQQDAKRASEFLGMNMPRAQYTIPRLPMTLGQGGEFLYDNTVTDYIVRSKVVKWRR